jgi:chromosomal replication initiator protein
MVLLMTFNSYQESKSGTQDVFFHILTTYIKIKQALTSDALLLICKDIEQRLLSRFKWGLSAEAVHENAKAR